MLSPPYNSAMPQRANLPLIDTIHIHENKTPLQSTGTVTDFPFRHPASGEEGEPQQVLVPVKTFDEEPPLFPPEETLPIDITKPPIIESSDDDDNTSINEFLDPLPNVHVKPIATLPPRCSQRPTHGLRTQKNFRNEYEELYHITTHQHPLRAMIALVKDSAKKDHPIDIFLPKPTSLKAVQHLPPEIRDMWIKLPSPRSKL